MAVSSDNIYQDLLSMVPTGSFYDPHPTVVPLSSSPYNFRLVTNNPNTLYNIQLNGDLVGTVITDASGIALVKAQLRQGDNTLTLSNQIVGSSLSTYVTARNWATWLASIADVLGGLDDQASQLLADRDLATVSLDRIDTVWGRRLHTDNQSNYPADTHRDILQILHRAYRRYGGHMLGLMDAIAAFTHVNPLTYRRNFGPTWYLGNQLATPREMNTWTRIASPASFSAISAGGAALSIDPGSNFHNEVGTASLAYDGAGTLTFTTPSGMVGTAHVDASTTHVSITVVPSPNVAVAYTEPGPFNTTNNVTLSLNIDDKGIIILTLPALSALSVSTLRDNINNALSADARYGAPYNAVASVVNNRVRIMSLGGSIVLHDSDTLDAASIIFGLPQSISTVVGTVSPSSIAAFALPLINTALFPLLDVENTYSVTIHTSPRRIYTVKSNNVGTNTLTLYATNDIFDIPDGTVVSVNGQLPFMWTPPTNSKPTLVLNITNPSMLSNGIDTFTISGTALPTGWISVTTPTNINTSLVRNTSWMHEASLQITNNTLDAWTIQTALSPAITRYNGFNIDSGIWVARDYSDSTNIPVTITFSMSVDGGVTWISNSKILGPTAARTPTYVNVITSIPYNCPGILISASCSGLAATGVNIRIEGVAARIVSHTGLNLGRGTIPRSQHRSKYDYICYIWAPQALSSSEKSLLGLSYGTRGHIDTITPSHINISRFEVTEIPSGGLPLNLCGCMSGTDLSAGTSTNMALQVRTPDRFSYLTPSVTSYIQGEVVIPSGTGPYTVTLNNPTAQDISQVTMYENGVPIPHDQLTFIGINIIQLAFTPDPTAIYTIDYQILIRYESIPIGVPGTPSDRTWFIDIFQILGLDFTPTSVPVTVGVQFDSAFVATLNERSDKDQSTSILYADDGVQQVALDASSWEYLSSQSIRIDPTIFNSRALYLLQYNARVAHPKTRPSATLEFRQGASPAACLSATYAPFTINQIVAPAAYVQFRITYSSVITVDEVRLYSLTLKGLNTNGVGGVIPVLRNRNWTPHPLDGV